MKKLILALLQTIGLLFVLMVVSVVLQIFGIRIYIEHLAVSFLILMFFLGIGR